MGILIWAIPFFILTMFIEWRLTINHDVKGYELKDSAASLSMGLGNLGVMFGIKIGTFALFMWVYQFRAFDLPTNIWWVWMLLIPCEDFCYYWFHRAGHEVRFFWAAHVNHHSSRTYNLSTALRQSWTAPLFSWLFWLPLPLLGFHPLMIVVAQSISLLYQYWLHTELIDRLGPFEFIFNTPSHHRVHHGRNVQYLDRNHGGIFIVWDRIFGTFQEEIERPDYGLTVNIETYNPVNIAFHEWQAIAHDVRHAKSWYGRFGALFCAPGWREDGSGRTSAVLRREWLASEQASQPESPELTPRRGSTIVPGSASKTA